MTGAGPGDFADLAALICARAGERPEHPALVLGVERLGYAALDRAIDRVAASLQRDGVGRGDVAAFCAGTSIEYLAVLLGCLRAGLAFAPLPPSADAGAIVAMAEDAGARILFLDRTETRRLHPGPRMRRVVLDDAGEDGLQAWLAPEGSVPLPAAITAATRFAIIYSSGTTATPKGIVQSHGMRWAGLRAGGSLGYGPDTVSIVSTPLYSNTTLVGLLPTLALGGTAVLMRKFEARELLVLSQVHRVSHAMLVPVQYARIMALPDFDTFDLSAYRMKFCTSAPFAPALKAEVVRRWPGHLLEFYGMTEGGGTCALLASALPHKLHTVGQPIPGHDVRVIDEQGREQPRGASGEIVGRSAGAMDGYHRRPQQSLAALWHDTEGRAYIRTGDIGHFDEDGFLVLSDRRKDLIISGGFNIFPSDLEAVLAAHEAVAEAAVVGVPSTEWGETPAAFVVLAPGWEIAAEALRDWANQRLGRTQRIAQLEFLDELPRSAIGKVQKRELRERLRPQPADTHR